jgi:putative ATP-binding cassette transporter
MYSLCRTVSALLEENEGLSKISGLVKRLNHAIVEVPKEMGLSATKNFRLRDNSITLTDVTVMADNQLLMKEVSFELFPGNTMLISGVKGCGKSALLRVIMGTWQPTMGEVSRPALDSKEVVCVPQKPYILVEASLREQVIYPESVDSKAVDNDRLLEALEVTGLLHLFQSHGTKSSSLTEAEQQKLMLCRLIYHNPRFALFDDCVKGLDLDYVVQILKFLKGKNCSVILACQPTYADAVRAKVDFDAELSFTGRQPPRYELHFKGNEINKKL